jgi:hypothetical protein
MSAYILSCLSIYLSALTSVSLSLCLSACLSPNPLPPSSTLLQHIYSSTHFTRLMLYPLSFLLTPALSSLFTYPPLFSPPLFFLPFSLLPLLLSSPSSPLFSLFFSLLFSLFTSLRYTSCPNPAGCLKKVIENNGQWRCEKCNQEFDTVSNSKRKITQNRPIAPYY